MKRGKWVCRLLGDHKWVRLETGGEEAYTCSRCGERHFGKPPGRSLAGFTGGAGGGGPVG
jgi:hypothetical protein